jgi:hypothetical protein
MAEHLYEVGWTFTSTAAAGPLGEVIPAVLAAGKRPPSIRELGVSINTPGAAVAELAFGAPAAVGITPATLQTVQADSTFDVIAGNTTVAKTWGTAPTAPTTPHRRWNLQPVAGAGVIWTWLPEERQLWSGAAITTLVIWQLSSQIVIYDLFLKVAE